MSLWVEHDAFAAPGRILTQIATMPDDRSYPWIARTTDSGGLGYRSPQKKFAIGLGFDIAYANKLVYADNRGTTAETFARPLTVAAGS